MSTDQPTDTAALAVALEGILSRIPGIRAARVVSDKDRISEIHIVAGTDRAPKQLVRDIQSAAKATFDVDIDYRTVSIVQIDEEAPTVAPAVLATDGSRLPLVRVVGSTSGQLCSMEVVLRQGDLELVGRVKGAASAADLLVARATLQAVSSLLSDSVGEILGVGISRIGDAEIAVVGVSLISPSGTRQVSGSAIVAAEAKDAIARATLDAVNRVAGYAMGGAAGT